MMRLNFDENELFDSGENYELLQRELELNRITCNAYAATSLNETLVHTEPEEHD